MLVQILIALAIIALLVLIVSVIYIFVVQSEKNEAKSEIDNTTDDNNS